MDPFIGGALISGATSLLGGLFGRSSAKKDLAMQRQLINEQNEYNNPTNIRKRAEDAGFNPLSFIGPGVGLQTQTAQVNSGNYMGAAIADAGMAFAGAMADKAKFAETKKLNDLEMANAKLQNKILQLTLRPKVGGVYAERQSTPTVPEAVGGGGVDVGSDPETYLGYVDHKVSAGAVGDSGGIDLKPKAVIVPHVSDGQSTGVPVGQDWDEILSGALIAANNRGKARKAFRERHADDMTFGVPLKAPWGLVDRTYELMPPGPSRHNWPDAEWSKHPPKAKGYQKNIYDSRPLFQQWGVY